MYTLLRVEPDPNGNPSLEKDRKRVKRTSVNYATEFKRIF
jgi:hypothetical protein